MIHVNVRGLLVREIENEKQLIIQLRKREGERASQKFMNFQAAELTSMRK